MPRLLGAGHLAFTVDQGPDTERYQGIVELAGASLTECASHYFRQSEQLETLLNLGVAHKEGRWRAYGLMVQKPPRPMSDFENSWDIASEDEEAADDWLRTASLVSTLGNDEGLDPAVSPEQLLYRLFHEDGVRVQEPRPLAFRCRCSRDKVVNTLRMLDRDEVAEMKVGDAVEVTCQFCNETYRFDDAELDAVYAGRRRLELAVLHRPADQVVDEGAAGVELLDRDELVGLVGLGDVARAADHRGHAGVLEMAGLGGEGHGRGPVRAGQPHRQRDRGRIRVRDQRRRLGVGLRDDRRRREHFPHPRQHRVLDIGLDPADHVVVGDPGDGPELPFEHAVARRRC